MQEPKRVPLNLLPQHLDFIVNLLGTANLPYVQTAPIIADIQQQVQTMNLAKTLPAVNGEQHASQPVQ